MLSLFHRRFDALWQQPGSFDAYPFAPPQFPGLYRHVALGDLAHLGQQRYDMFIGLAVHRGRGDAQFAFIAEDFGQRVGAGFGLDAQAEDKVIVIEGVPHGGIIAHGDKEGRKDSFVYGGTSAPTRTGRTTLGGSGFIQLSDTRSNGIVPNPFLLLASVPEAHRSMEGRSLSAPGSYPGAEVPGGMSDSRDDDFL